MGLDMYVYKKPKKSGDREVIYWRKANQIFRWLEINCCNGVTENCKEYDVTYEQLLQLRSICQRVLMNREHAEELLPCQRGFFFGSQEYDEWYFKDLEDTIKEIDKLNPKDSFIYYAWW